MGKLNEQLKAELTFERRQLEDTDEGYKRVIISTTHKGIYRQYSFVVYPTDLKGNPTDYALLEEEGKNILTHSIDLALKAMNETK